MLSEFLAEIPWDVVSWIAVGLILCYIYTSSFRTVGEYERLAIFFLGRFSGFKGPGRVFIHPLDMKLYTVSIGTPGVLVADDVGQFSGINLPVRQVGNLELGANIQITAFDDLAAVVEAGPAASINRCPECGHQFW